MTPEQKPEDQKPDAKPEAELGDADLDKFAGGSINGNTSLAKRPTIDPIDVPIAPSGALDLNDLKRPT